MTKFRRYPGHEPTPEQSEYYLRKQEFARRLKIKERRENWLTREWLLSRNGNPYLNVDGHNVVIYPVGVGWGYRESDSSGATMFSPKPLDSADAAKLQAFDALFKR